MPRLIQTGRYWLANGTSTAVRPKCVNGSIATAATWIAMNTRASSDT
jgi:hypothetical protein